MLVVEGKPLSATNSILPTTTTLLLEDLPPPEVGFCVTTKGVKMEIKAIETVYNGYKFRSRLEARWAVFFDAAGVEYEYEPEGFVLPSGKRYLPDFLIHNCTERGPKDLWVEVKGSMSKDDAEKIEEFGKTHPIIVVDQIPKGRTAEELWENMTSRGFNKMMNSSICPFNFMLVDGDYFSFGLLANGNGGCALCGADFSYFSGYHEDLTVYAYNKARQARFEYGECG